jgi:hypothetical protein
MDTLRHVNARVEGEEGKEVLVGKVYAFEVGQLVACWCN